MTNEAKYTTIEAPGVYTYHNVMYWEPKSRELLELKKDGSKTAATILTKSKKFLELNCIKQNCAREYICEPIKGYNKTTYNISISPDGEYSCDCQGFENSKFCSHCLAVKQFIFINGEKLNLK